MTPSIRFNIAAGTLSAATAIIAAVVLAVACTPAPATAQDISPAQRARMCDDLRMMADEGDRGALGIWTRHCSKPIAVPRVEVDPITVARAQNCMELARKANKGDPVARYDFVKASEAGLCKR